MLLIFLEEPFLSKRKNHGLHKNLSWEIHKKISPYQCGSKRCDLRLSEKGSIICRRKYNFLGQRLETVVMVWFLTIYPNAVFC